MSLDLHVHHMIEDIIYNFITMGEKKIIKVFILILLGAALAFYLGSQCAKRDLKINIGNDK